LNTAVRVIVFLDLKHACSIFGGTVTGIDADMQQAEQRFAARWRVLALLGIAQFMLILDVTVVAIALPQMAADLA
jgi:hypothetical protein